MLRFLLWRLLGLLALLACFVLADWFLRGGPGRLLRGSARGTPHLSGASIAGAAAGALNAAWRWAPLDGHSLAAQLAVALLAGLAVVGLTRLADRRHRRYVRLRVLTYRTDQATRRAPCTIARASSM